MDFGMHIGCRVSTYQADTGINQSLLKSFGKANTPAHFHYEQSRPRKESPDLRIGSYVDAGIFFPEELAGQFATFTGKIRKGADWEAFKKTHQGKTILNMDEWSRAGGCILALKEHDDAQKIFKASHHQVVIIAEHPVFGVRMKGLIDCLPDQTRCHHLLARCIFDVKKSWSAKPEDFDDTCSSFGYHIQAAYYLDLASFVGLDADTFGFIVVEDEKPHKIKIHYIRKGSAVYNWGKSEYERLMVSYLECVRTDTWPDYGSDWAEVLYKPWQLRKEIERERLE